MHSMSGVIKLADIVDDHDSIAILLTKKCPFTLRDVIQNGHRNIEFARQVIKKIAVTVK